MNFRNWLGPFVPGATLPKTNFGLFLVLALMLENRPKGGIDLKVRIEHMELDGLAAENSPNE